jgi:hypothetical protein
LNNNHQSISEGVAVELYLDAAAEEQVLKFRELIYREGVQPVQGLMNDKLHISLAVFPITDPAAVIDLTREFALTVPRFSFRLGAVGTFPTQDNVLFLSPVPSVPLLQVHAAFLTRVKDAGINCSPYYFPGVWVPHLTLEFEISNDELCRSMKVFKESFTPIDGEFTQLGVVQFRPIQYLDQFDLQKGN